MCSCYRAWNILRTLFTLSTVLFTCSRVHGSMVRIYIINSSTVSYTSPITKRQESWYHHQSDIIKRSALFVRYKSWIFIPRAADCLFDKPIAIYNSDNQIKPAVYHWIFRAHSSSLLSKWYNKYLLINSHIKVRNIHFKIPSINLKYRTLTWGS